MRGFGHRRLSRRALLRSSASLVAGSFVLGRKSTAEARAGSAVQVLVHDEVQDSAAFQRGRHLGTTVRADLLQGTGVFESEPIVSPFAFTHVGLHWRGNFPAGSFEVRTSPDGLIWSGWISLHIEVVSDQAPAGDTFASLVAASRDNYLQYRTTLAQGQSLNRVTATFLNSYDAPTIATSTAASVTKPAFVDISREEWGCDESLRFDRRGREIWPRMYVPVKKLVVHHTAGRNDYTPETAAFEVNAVYTYHARTQGWGDIGYHVLIDRFGRSYEGRYSRDLASGREVCGPDVVAGHALAHNYGSFGVALVGEFESTYAASASDTLKDLNPPEVMLSRLADVLAFRAAERQIDPYGVSHFLKSDGTWNDWLPNISGHKDTFGTLCPGDLIYARLGAIRDAVSARLTLGAAPVFLSGPEGGPSNPSQSIGTVTFTWAPGEEVTPEEAAEYRYYLEGWYKSSASEAVTYLSGFTSDRYPLWSDWTTETSRTYTGLGDGHYTMHLLRRDGSGMTLETNRTMLLSGVNSPGKKPPRR